MYAYSELEQFIYSQIPAGLAWHSRLHIINRYADIPDNATLYIKREDEMGTISGSKLRKYASLQQYIRRNGYDILIAAGGTNSNNLLGLTMMSREMNIAIQYVIPEAHQNELVGNNLWRQLIMDKNWDKLFAVPRESWPPKSNYIYELIQQAEREGKHPLYIPEGCAMIEAIPGAMTLCLDVVRNCMENDVEFEHIFIDSGTGLQAIAFLSALVELWPFTVLPKVYITLIAGTEEEFTQRAKVLAEAFTDKYRVKINPLKNHIIYIKPPVAASFGQVNSTILKEVHKMANKEGILLDPIYGIKHAMATMHEINKRQLKGNILMINSGNAMGLCGFQDKLSALVGD